ncbi:hypothetical protein GOBAR_AA22679 [Gossypium barbadense]|uniref:RNase H type-1 domain-containing protein n=1 Tax=Gossypium barbadense TaxID=3634 RepID=A0A2P5X3U7_GOSBA|nr:hypothetical protein GOBAR_AA22679 [Gossypium barbadense]
MEESIKQDIKDLGSHQQGFRKWSYPSGESVKVNFDGAYDGRHFQSASRIVARTNEVTVLLSCSEIHQEVASTFAAEALACRKAVQIGIKMQWLEIVIEDILATESLKKKEEVYLVKSVPRYADRV